MGFEPLTLVHKCPIVLSLNLASSLVEFSLWIRPVAVWNQCISRWIFIKTYILLIQIQNCDINKNSHGGQNIRKKQFTLCFSTVFISLFSLIWFPLLLFWNSERFEVMSLHDNLYYSCLFIHNNSKYFNIFFFSYIKLNGFVFNPIIVFYF